MLTANQATAYIGRTGRLAMVGHAGRAHLTAALAVAVKVLDAREVFGRLDLFVAPLAGDGAAWVEARRVTLDEQTNG